MNDVVRYLTTCLSIDLKTTGLSANPNWAVVLRHLNGDRKMLS